jgi:hypothetical protein
VTIIGSGVGLVVLLMLVLIIARRMRYSGLKDAWEKAAWSLSLPFQGAGSPDTWRIQGTLKGLVVTVQLIVVEASKKVPKKEKKSKPGQFVIDRTRIVVKLGGDFPSNLAMHSRQRGGGGGHYAMSGVVTGDDTFDRAVELRGDTVDILARLNHKVRERALAVIPRLGVVVDEGKVLWDSRGALSKAKVIVDRVKSMVGFAVSLRGNGEPSEHNLLMHCTRDPNQGVKRLSLSTLLNRYPYKGETYRACVTIMGASDPLTLMISGMQAGEAGLARVQNAALSSSLPAEFRIRALEHLITEHPEAGDTVTSVVGPIIEKIPEREAIRLVELLSSMPQAVAQTALLAFLRLPAQRAQIAALVELGKIANDDVIPRLEAMVQGEQADTKMKFLAKQTIASIRNRSLSNQMKVVVPDNENGSGESSESN